MAPAIGSRFRFMMTMDQLEVDGWQRHLHYATCTTRRRMNA